MVCLMVGLRQTQLAAKDSGFVYWTFEVTPSGSHNLSHVQFKKRKCLWSGVSDLQSCLQLFNQEAIAFMLPGKMPQLDWNWMEYLH